MLWFDFVAHLETVIVGKSFLRHVIDGFALYLWGYCFAFGDNSLLAVPVDLVNRRVVHHNRHIETDLGRISFGDALAVT